MVDTILSTTAGCVGLHTSPAIELRRRRWIVVAGHQMLAAVQPGEEPRDNRRFLADREIAQVPDFIAWPNTLVPKLDKALVHCRDRWERPAVQAQRAAVSKMRITGEEDRHCSATPRTVMPRALATEWPQPRSKKSR